MYYIITGEVSECITHTSEKYFSHLDHEKNIPGMESAGRSHQQGPGQRPWRRLEGRARWKFLKNTNNFGGLGDSGGFTKIFSQIPIAISHNLEVNFDVYPKS